MTNDDNMLPFTVENSVDLVRGLGYMGTHKRIVDWKSVSSPFIRDTCPACGYDRVMYTEHVNPENSNDRSWKCQGCGLSKERIEEGEKERRKREDEVCRAVERRRKRR